MHVVKTFATINKNEAFDKINIYVYSSPASNSESIGNFINVLEIEISVTALVIRTCDV